MHEMMGSKTGQGAPTKDKNSTPVLTRDEQKRQWVKYFKETLNQPSPPTTLLDNLLTPADNLHVEVRLITVVETIQALKNGKAMGLDKIAPDRVKYRHRDVARELMHLLNASWAQAKVPYMWRRGVSVCLPKKGNLLDCNNWRGITLFFVLRKVLCVVLL
ncbi:endonuclease-reverse transcriptase [Labeo rohita]|uniref:Endonuclease-reverse transcriptase n=1 Tax=Labeo rohita TaxID=84645 RepID=A0A498MKQ6_LABRO|nr:endonuclease-reverse transcriptase [Labeo rohita]